MATDIPHRHIDLPGGAVVLLAGTGGSNPPGHTGGMQTNSCEAWVRLVRGEWDSGWHRAQDRSLVKLAAWWGLAWSDDDIPDVWALTVGGVWPPPRYDDVFYKGVAWLDGVGR